MKYAASALAMAGMAATVRGHGFITSPTARMPGAAMEAACGQQVYYNQEGDNYGNIQGELQVAATQTDYNAAECNLWMCKGYKFADNDAANVQAYTAGQVVDFKFDIRAPHTGTANVSIVDTATNAIIGTPLIHWDSFASTASSDYANQTAFSITIPSDLGSSCSTAGACVIQHWWDAASVDQTYESCVDFTVGGSGSSASAVSSTAVSSTAVSSAAASSAVSVSSVVANTQIAAVSTSASATSSVVASATSSVATAATASSTSTGTSTMPEGLTMEDALAAVNYLYSNGETTYTANTKARRHARGFRA